MFLRGNDYLPTGEIVTPPMGPWDDTFMEIVGVPTITWPGAAKLEIESDAPYWTVYDQHEDAICVEPVTAPPDCANLNIVGDDYIEALFTFTDAD
jgi:aldose 1-epimerase